MINKNFIFIQNLITPYRTYFFNELKKRKFDFEVLYMGLTEADRNWAIDPSTLKYNYWIDRKGFYKYLKGIHFHFNPRLILRILKNRNSDVIFGVSWNDINILILSLFKHIGILKNNVHCWTEANYLTLGAKKDNMLKYYLRRFVYSSVDGAFIIPGEMAKITLQKWNIKINYVVYLPNLIEEDKFYIEEEDLLQRSKNRIPQFILPVRLDEKFKGLLNFFEAIGTENIKKCNFLIAGEGPDRKLYEKYIFNNTLEENINLLGFCDFKKLRKLYGDSNVFLLPSFSDQSPLSTIEALKMKLPILVSNKCGNNFETLQDGVNGYSFDPYNHSSIKDAFQKMLDSLSRQDKMGKISSEIYYKNFDVTTTLDRFIYEMNKI